VYVSPESQAKIDSFLAQQRREEQDHGKEEEIELMESELMDSWKILTYLQNKYAYQYGSHDNLMSLKMEADDLFAKIGLQVVVDWVMPGLFAKPRPPVITIVGRLAGFEYDPERARFEIGKGVADKYYDAKRRANKNKLIVPGT